MRKARIPARLRRQVEQRDGNRCVYCLTPEGITGQRLHVDHVLPEAVGGQTDADNLCLACSSCNGSKAYRTWGQDPASGEKVAFFNPRTQSWGDHFAWSDDGRRVVGLTPCGRATVSALRLNNPLLSCGSVRLGACRLVAAPRVMPLSTLARARRRWALGRIDGRAV